MTKDKKNLVRSMPTITSSTDPATTQKLRSKEINSPQDAIKVLICQGATSSMNVSPSMGQFFSSSVS